MVFYQPENNQSMRTVASMCVFAAILQYQWVGQLSTAARERLQRNVRIAAAQFREAFDGEILRAVVSLQVGPATVREGVSERLRAINGPVSVPTLSKQVSDGDFGIADLQAGHVLASNSEGPITFCASKQCAMRGNPWYHL